MNSSEPLVCFSHGKESGPWGTKITRLAEVARQHGFAVMSPDYTHTMDPHERVRMLRALAPTGAPLVLVGSSMGGYVAAQSCAFLQPDALFLMAPALYFPDWEEEPTHIPEHCLSVHGRHDDIVPLAAAERFCQTHGGTLQVLDAGHTLNECLEQVAGLFDDFLATLPVSGRPAPRGAG